MDGVAEQKLACKQQIEKLEAEVNRGKQVSGTVFWLNDLNRWHSKRVNYTSISRKQFYCHDRGSILQTMSHICDKEVASSGSTL